MEYEAYLKAVAEAKRFLKVADSIRTHSTTGEGHPKYIYIDTGKESGALRRVSMDLTRALAQLRKP